MEKKIKVLHGYGFPDLVLYQKDNNTLAVRDEVDGEKKDFEVNRLFPDIDALMEGTPVNAVASTLTTDLGVEDADLKYTANTKGVIGDEISIAYVGNRNSLTKGIEVDGYDIVVTLKTDADGVESAAVLGTGNSQVTVTMLDGGTFGDDYTLVVQQGGSQAVLVFLVEKAIKVYLSTNPTHNTATLVATAINRFLGAGEPLIEELVVAVAGGTGAGTVAETAEPVAFTGGVDPSTNVACDADAVIALIEGDTEADALVSVEYAGEDDGSGLPIHMPAENLADGVDGTIAVKNQLYSDGEYIYIATDENTTADTNWVAIPILLPDGSITTAKLANESVTAAKLAGGMGVQAMLALGLGASGAYDETTDEELELLAASDPDVVRTFILIVTVTDTFDDGIGAQTVFTIGDEDDPDLYMVDTILVDAVEGTILVLAGELADEKALTVTGTAATEDGTGAISVVVLALPKETIP